MKRTLRPTWTALGIAGATLIAGGAYAATPTYNQTVYGISRSAGHLLRYDFSSGHFKDIGAITDKTGHAYPGIKAGAYVPGFENLFAFWTDSSNQARLVYVDVKNAHAAIVGQSLGTGTITGAVVVPPAGGGTTVSWPCYAVQDNVGGGEPIDFTIDGDTIVANQAVAAKVTVLGAAITYGGQYDIPVTLEVSLGGTMYEPFGKFGDVADGNVNDGHNPRGYVFPDTYAAGTRINITARSWMKQGRWGRTSWSTYMTVDGSRNSPNLIVLRDGDKVPDITPFMNQTSINSYVQDYVDPNTHRVKLLANQAICLFELGTTDVHSDAADFQDLVVLVTLASNKDTLGTSGGGTTGPAANLISVNTKTGAAQTIMALSRSYDDLTSLDGKTFYATSGNALYRIDAVNKTEIEVGTMAWSHVPALGFAGQQLSGFQTDSNTFNAVDAVTAQSTASFNISMSDLGTIVFVNPVQDPANLPSSYD